MSKNYRTDARTVRAAAQAKLSELRAKRRANRAQDGRKNVAEKLAAPAAEQSAEAHKAVPEAAETAAAPEVTGSAEPKAQAATPSKKRKSRTRKRKSPETTQPDAEMSPTTAGALQVSAVAEHLSNVIDEESAQEDANADVVAEVPEESALPKPAQRKRAARKPSQAGRSASSSEPGEKPDALSDLYALPGVGSGLVDLLHTCGVNSLSDLAQADTGSLRRDMGLPGELLNLDSWVAEAARRVE